MEGQGLKSATLNSAVCDFSWQFSLKNFANGDRYDGEFKYDYFSVSLAFEYEQIC